MPSSMKPDSDSTTRALARRVLAIRTPLDWPIGLLLFLLPVSLWATFDIRFSLPKVVGLLLGLAIFYATVAYIGSAEHLVRALILYFLLGTGIAALGLIGTSWLYKNPLLSEVTQRLPQWIGGLPGAAEGFHPNEVAGVLLWFVPLQLALLVWFGRQSRLRTWRGIALCFSTVLTTLTLVLTQSRGGLLGLAAGLAVMGAGVDRRVRTAVALLSIVALVIVAVQGPAWVDAALREGVAPEVLGRSNWSFRIGVWRAALSGIADFPFTGMGLGTFRRVARVLYPLASVPPDYDIAHAHNGFLQAALDFGVVGLFAYTAIWFLSAKMILSSLQQAENWWRATALGFGGCLVSSFVYNLMDTVALGAKGGLPWWMMLGLIVGIFRLLSDSARDEGTCATVWRCTLPTSRPCSTRCGNSMASLIPTPKPKGSCFTSLNMHCD